MIRRDGRAARLVVALQDRLGGLESQHHYLLRRMIALRDQTSKLAVAIGRDMRADRQRITDLERRVHNLEGQHL